MTIGRWMAVCSALVGGGANAQTAPTLSGSPGDFVGAESYPPAAIRAGAEGKVIARLNIDAMGVVRACTIDETSGNADLDAATCRSARKMSFEPARDARGKAVAGTYRLPVRWTLPKTILVPPNVFQPAVRISTEVHVGPDGIITSCKVLANVGAAPEAMDPCDSDRPGEARGMVTNGGKPTGYTQVRTMDVKVAFDN